MLSPSTYQPIDEYNFPMSFAMTGSTIPGIKKIYPTRLVSYLDFTSVVDHRKRAVDPVHKFPNTQQENARGHPAMEKLKQLLTSSSQPQMRPGFQRIKEDLTWRAMTAAPQSSPV